VSAFASALAVLHADPNMATDAEFRRPPGNWTALRILLSKPADEVPGFGSPGGRAGTIEATVLAADCTPLSPARGDEMRIASVVHRVEAVDRDALGLSWRLTLAPTG
jgi:hypothetical protein